MANPNYDYDTQKSAIDRRRKMLEAMQLQGMQPLQGSNIHPMQGIAQVLSAYLGAKGQQDLRTEEQDLAQRYKQDLTSGIDRYMTTLQGQPESRTPFPGGQAEGLNPDLISPAVAGDPKTAMLEALSSNHPVLQQLGMSQLTALGKKEAPMSQKDWLGLSGYDRKSVLAAMQAGDPGLLKPEAREHVVDGRIVTGVPGEGKYSVAGDFRPQFSSVEQLAVDSQGNPIIGQRELSTGKASFAPRGTNVNVNTNQKASEKFAGQLAEKRANRLDSSFETAQSASQSLDALNAAAQDFSAGIKSGAPAEIALGFSKWAKALGLGDVDPAIANTEAFRANMAKQVLSNVKALGSGTGISNADRDYAEKAAGGSITLDDQAMYRLMNIGRAAAANTLIGHHALLEKNMNASGAIPEDLETYRVPFTIPMDDNLDWSPSTGKVIVRGAAGPKPGKPSSSPIPGQKPAAPPKPTGGVISADDYFKRLGL